ncbi:MAG: thiol-activated cytolysin family protein [Bacteroidales bacterium]|nr:thiol-activated cytolysin family protein [Bacteroidales bacterium]
MKSKFFIVGLLSAIIIIASCEDPIDYSEDVNNLITSAGHFDEPPHYDPSQVGDPTITTETINGVQYQKTETKYKYAQKFESKTQATFSSKKNLKSDNDVFLGAIIQGKYWRQDGDLISIGSFDRKDMTITISGIDINGSNSITAYPSNAGMTDAINTLTNTTEFSPNTSNYTFKNEIAHTKQQIGLSFGIHPSWMENLGFDFGIENTYETNTVYVYFKQIYYTVSAELPAQPSDFFTDDVDLTALNSKITSDNPAGYISSIDYGRVVVVKMTSSYNKTDMKAAIGAVFQSLNIGVSGEYQNIIENSTFEARIYGGNATNVITDLEETINLINSGMEITNLQSAVPIEYHVHYLDGGSFNTGSEIEYTETDYAVTSASTMAITKVTFTQLPNMQAGYWDDWTDYPDVYLGITKWNGTQWQSVHSYNDDYYEEVTSTMLDNEEISWNTNFEISDFDMIYALDAWDYDSSGDDDWMGDVQFTVNNDIINSGDYPISKVLYNSETGVRVKIEIEWREK